MYSSKTISVVVWMLLSLICTEAAAQSHSPGGIRSTDSLRAESYPANVTELKSGLKEAFDSNDYATLERISRRILSESRERGDDVLRLKALENIVWAYWNERKTDSLPHYATLALDLARTLGDTLTIASVSNTMGIYYVDVEADYRKGLSFLLESLNHTDKSLYPDYYMRTLSNVATTYYLRNDPAGLPYAREIYEQGVASGDRRTLFTGLRTMAYMHYLSKDYDRALDYISRAAEMTEEYGFRASVYNTYGNVLLSLGREQEAVHYFRKALSYPDEQPSSLQEAFLNYGNYLMGKGRYGEAIEQYERGLGISLENRSSPYRHKLYMNLSASLEARGNEREALKYYKLYHLEADSIFNVERERSVSELRIQYESERKERELQHKENELLKESKRSQTILFVLLLVFCSAGVTILLYHRRTRTYKRIVRQQQDFLKKQSIDRLVRSVSEDAAPADRYLGSSLSENKAGDLLGKLEACMQRDRLYCDPDITREKLAGIMETNTTYLSRVINEYTGMSFSGYINSCRINEAVAILSDAGNDVQLKALAFELGFNSQQTFARSFQKAIGMSPSRYREEIRKSHSRPKKS